MPTGQKTRTQPPSRAAATTEAAQRAAPAAAPSRTSARESDGDVPWLVVRGARHNNLKNVTAEFPLGRFTVVTGVSGSGKSSLVNDILYEALAFKLNNAVTARPGEHDGLDGIEHLDKIIAIDQTPIGRTPRSNPATYIKLFDEIRDLFTKLPDAKLRGYKAGRFSFNVAGGRRGGGRCEACEGNGSNRIEMDFLADVWVTCPVCEGRRFTRETLQIQFKGRSIGDVLEMDVQQALAHFDSQPRIRGMVQTLHDVGLDYIKLGQPSPTLSGGEAQRIKLARELVKKPTGRTVYVLDEPTTGLHFEDVRRLLAVLHGFVDAGNTVIVIEHNLDVIKTADWIIDLGPEGGAAGGRIVAAGTPEEVAARDESFTGEALRRSCELRVASIELKNARSRSGGAAASELDTRNSKLETPSVLVRGARQHNLRDITVAFPRDRMTVCTGVSGSGKTSFAIDTVFTEGYRRYVESLSAYARQFLGQMAKPAVEHVEGLSPAICIEQKAASRSPRSTVGTVTEIYDYMRVLWARLGTPYCPRCQTPIGTQTVDEIVDRVMALPHGSPIMLLAPVKLGDGENWAGLFTRLKRSGYTRVRIDGDIQQTAQATTLDVRRKHRVEVVVDRTIVKHGDAIAGADIAGARLFSHPTAGAGIFPHPEGDAGARVFPHPDPQSAGARIFSHPDQGGTPPAPPPPSNRARIAESVEHALALGNGLMVLLIEPTDTVPAAAEAAGESTPPSAAREVAFSQKLACLTCGESFEELSPHHFSFNSQMGWCETCEGLGVQRGAPAGQIITHPRRGLLSGAVAGWPHIDARSPMGRLLTALCEHLGVGADTPLERWTTAQKNALLFGLDRPLGAADGGMRGGAASAETWIDGSAALGGSGRDGKHALRFQWRGFFPTLDSATRHSWSLRHKLHAAVTDIPCLTCRGGRLRADAAAVRLEGRGQGAEGPRGQGVGRAQPAADASAVGRAQPAAGARIFSHPTTGETAGARLFSHPSTIGDICDLPLRDGLAWFDQLALDDHQRRIAGEVLVEIKRRVQFLIDVGLDYLTLHRAAPTLSGGESQRIRLASQIGSGLSGVLYVLDEPTIGLHPRDTQRLVRALQRLRDLGNTLLLVEHDREVIAAADRLIDFGPRAGSFGGQVVAEGPPTALRAADGEPSDAATRATDKAASVPRSLTRGYLNGELAIPVPANRRPIRAEGWSAAEHTRQEVVPVDAEGRPLERLRTAERLGAKKSRRQPAGDPRAPQSAAAPAALASFDDPNVPWLIVRGARQNNLKNIDIPIPLGRLVCVTGVSGSGKSSLVSDILWPALAREIQLASLTVGEHDRIDLVHPDGRVVPFVASSLRRSAAIDKVINVDQSPLGVTPHSSPATYTGVFDWIRELFARLPESKMRGYQANRFSFNRPGGRCEACEGFGQKRIEMHFMPDVWVTCEACHGKRYEPETLAVRFKEHSIADVLDLRVSAALDLFASVPKVRRLLQTLADVGLGYVQLGQPAPTLSGGEAQRVKLAAELGKPDTGRTFYILDEPTTGLHFDDVRKLLDVLHRLVDLGNTVLVVEHNLDVLKSADWIIDLGPEAGEEGGRVVAMGTPEGVVSSGELRVSSWEDSAEVRTMNAEGETHNAEARTLNAEEAAGGAPSACSVQRSAFESHTARALAPILSAGPNETRPRYDPAAHAAEQMAVEKARLGNVGKEVRMPWQVDGRRWHLEQRESRDARPRRWEPAALEYVLDLVQKAGDFAPTNWNERASVEVTAAGAETWFLHALTGGEWLLELYFITPAGTFSAAALNRDLGLKTLDERGDLQKYGNAPRVDVRERRGGVEAVVIYVHDRAEIDTPAFRRFIRKAAQAYQRGVGR